MISVELRQSFNMLDMGTLLLSEAMSVTREAGKGHKCFQKLNHAHRRQWKLCLKRCWSQGRADQRL